MTATATIPASSTRIRLFCSCQSTDSATASAVEAMGAKHIDCSADDFVVDEKFKVYSTPAYMLASNTAEIDLGVSKMLASMLK